MNPASFYHKNQLRPTSTEETPLEEFDEEIDGIASELSSGIFMLTGSIDTEQANSIITYIIEACLEKKLQNLTLIINSNGGSVSAAFAIISMMKSSTIPVNTIALGSCASAALMIFMAGAKRYIDKNTSVLSHQFSGAYPNLTKAVDLKSMSKSLLEVERKMEDLYVECTGLDLNVVRQELLTSHDVYLTAEECITYNIADEHYKSMTTFIQ